MEQPQISEEESRLIASLLTTVSIDYSSYKFMLEVYERLVGGGISDELARDVTYDFGVKSGIMPVERKEAPKILQLYSSTLVRKKKHKTAINNMISKIHLSTIDDYTSCMRICTKFEDDKHLEFTMDLMVTTLFTLGSFDDFVSKNEEAQEEYLNNLTDAFFDAKCMLEQLSGTTVDS